MVKTSECLIEPTGSELPIQITNMRAKDIAKVVESLKPLLPGFKTKGAMIYKEKDDVLQAICIEDSGLDKQSFYVWVFFLPLYIPLKQLVFTFGKRLSHGKRWASDAEAIDELSEAIKREALPYLHSIDTSDRLSQVIAEIDRGPNKNLNLSQAYAYSLAKEGQREPAIVALKEIISRVNQSPNSHPWTLRIREHCESMLENLEVDREGRVLEELAENSRNILGLSPAD